MEHRWEKDQRVQREESYKHQRENPSFSSTLLDSIYRSIDESGGREADETMRKKKNLCGLNGEGRILRKEEEIKSLRRACMVEKWMEKKVVGYEKVANGRRKTMAECNSLDRSAGRPRMLMNSSSSSSESSSVGGFSSSESESFYGDKSSKSSTTYRVHRPPSIRTSVNQCPDRNSRPVHYHRDQEDGRKSSSAPTQKLKNEGKGSSFGETKSRALKIYGDLKKVKQPLSPGGRLATFLNSIFTNVNSKKPKFSSSSSGSKTVKPPEEEESTCSSASSFSRSCLSKTPSSRGKLSSNGVAQRSVRFYPVSVIVDEDSKPCGHKNLVSPTNEELKVHLMSENLRVEEVARDLLRSYHKKVADTDRDEHVAIEVEEEEEEDDDDDDDDDDDGASYESSDLFELDNLSSIGINNGHRYREELPVYETTHVGTNRAIKLARA